METIGKQKIWTFLDRSKDCRITTNTKVRTGAGHKVSTYLELAQKIVATMMQPDYLALLRTTIADTHRFPQLGGIFRATVPERAMRSFAVFIEKSRKRGVVGPGVDGDTAARMFVGPLLTYAVLDGLLTEGPPRPPAREKIEEIVDLYTQAITDNSGKEAVP